LATVYGYRNRNTGTKNGAKKKRPELGAAGRNAEESLPAAG